jgi:hypothetical protein
MNLSHARDTGNEEKDSRNTTVYTPAMSNMSSTNVPGSHEDILMVEGDIAGVTYT